jgi:hypothetical protein
MTQNQVSVAATVLPFYEKNGMTPQIQADSLVGVLSFLVSIVNSVAATDL